MLDGTWLTGGRPGRQVRLRLFCFPFAGGGAATYHGWPAIAPPGVHVSAVEYPGRGMRVGEQPCVRLAPLVRDLADRIGPLMAGPVAFFGHSMGGLVAYELTRALRARGAPGPRHLFISAASTPGARSPFPALAGADDTEVLEHLRELGGTPPELLDDRELMAIAVRALRADSCVIGTYQHRPGPPLDVPITVFGGRSDELVPPAQLRGWAAHTSAGCDIRLLAGDHFFVRSAAREILRTVAGVAAGAAMVG